MLRLSLFQFSLFRDRDKIDDDIDMVKLSRILSFIFVLRLQTFAESFQNVVFVNNKQMVYNLEGQLVESKSSPQASVDKRLKWKPVKLVEKSNIFKDSSFVTNSSFKRGNNKFIGSKNNSAFHWFLPTRKYLNNRSHLVTKYRLPKLPLIVQTVQVLDTTTSKPLKDAVVLNDEITSVQNSLMNIDEDIFKSHLVKLPTTTVKPKPVETTNEKPLTFVFSTNSPTTNQPVTVHPTKRKKKKRKNKLKKKRKILSTTSKPKHESFMQNLDSYRKIFMQNATKDETKMYQENITTGGKVVETTPKPDKPDEQKVKKRKKNTKKKRVESDHVSEVDTSVQSKEEVVYVDAQDSSDYDYVSKFFSKFYNFFEDALTSKEMVEYRNDASNSESEEEEEEEDFRRKRRSTKKQKEEPPESRKSLTTKITVTSEYDDSPPGLTTPPSQPSVQHSVDSITRKPLKRPDRRSSEESDELTLYDAVIGSGDDYEDSEEDDEDQGDSYEDYDEPARNRLPEGDIIRDSPEDYSNEDDAPSFSFFDGVSQMFAKIGNFFSSFSGSTREPSSVEYEYYDEGRSTTEKAERQSKRPKRENEPLAWYQPSFLFSDDDNDDEKAVSSTTHRNWLQSPWQQNDDEDENEIVTETPLTTTTLDSTLTSTSEAPLFNFLELVSQYISPRKRAATSKPKVKLRRRKYDDYELWRLLPKSKDDVNTIEEFKMSPEGAKFHWMKGPSSRGITDVVVPPHYVESFRDFLSENDLHFDVKVRDIQHAIQFENPRLNKRDQIELEVIYGHPLTWYRYHPYKDIQSYYEYLKRKFPNYTELIQIGWSFEGRPLTIVKVSHPRDDDVVELRKEHRTALNKPAIFIQSGLEAHEWLPIACSTYILNNLVNNIESNDTLGEMIRKVDWYIMPVLNPDGYDYSIYYDRLWQKTRSKHFPSSGIWASA